MEEFVLEDVVTVLGPDGAVDPATDPGLPPARVVALYEAMVRTRVLDERLVLLQRQGRIGFHIGSMGEEATILGSAAALEDHDWLFPCYREFGALLLRGMPLQRYIDNMYGNGDDPVKGRQMPDHYTGRAYRFGSVSSPIGTQITQAVGFSWAAKMKGDPSVSLVYFGEGATSSSEFHNGLNFAGVFKTPTVFLCRNNGWAISVPVEKQTGAQTFAQKGFAYGVRAVRVDGNDLLAVYKATRDALDRARRGEGPTLIEALTHRLSGPLHLRRPQGVPQGAGDARRAPEGSAAPAAGLPRARGPVGRRAGEGPGGRARRGDQGRRGVGGEGRAAAAGEPLRRGVRHAARAPPGAVRRGAPGAAGQGARRALSAGFIGFQDNSRQATERAQCRR
jgi:TPP-dependent pyruvate/acetoin dehydrogenase alpha subunit